MLEREDSPSYWLQIPISGHTFEAIAREWLQTNIAKWTPDYGKNILHRLTLDVFPAIGKRPIAELEVPDLLNMLRQVEKRGALEITRRLGQTCGQVFRHAIAAGRAKRNPFPDLKDALKPVIKGHYAALEAKDLPEFIRVLDRNDARLYHSQSLDYLQRQHLAHSRVATKLQKGQYKPKGMQWKTFEKLWDRMETIGGNIDRAFGELAAKVFIRAGFPIHSDQLRQNQHNSIDLVPLHGKGRNVFCVKDLKSGLGIP